MSGLNDDIEEDIEQELPSSDRLEITPDQFKTIDNSLAKPGINQPPAPSIILKVGEDSVDAEGKSITPTITELFGDDVVPNELPDLNAKIVVIEDNKNTINDATSALNTIQANNAISQEDINEIDAIFPGYLGDKERIEYYTKTPTLTRYTTAVNTVGFKIAEKKEEQQTLTLDTFNLLKDSVVKTQAYLKDSLLTDNDVKKKKLSESFEYVKQGLEDKDISGYHKVISELLVNNLYFEVPHSVRKIPGLLDNALAILARPTAFASFLNKILFLREGMDQDFVFYSLSDPNNFSQNLSEKNVKASLQELIEYVYSDEKIKLAQLLDDILASAVTYIDNSIFALKDHDASDIGKEPEPLVILKRESTAIISVNTLIADMLEFDKVICELVNEFSRVINSIP